MSDRYPLRQQLTDAWNQTLKDAYAARLINSERGLQAHFCLALLAKFREAKVKRWLFIEPRMQFTETIRRYPDIVICNRDRIIGVVELKYTPRGRPSPDKDVNTLVRLSKERGKITLANERYRGPTEIKEFSVAKDAVLCWAGVYASPRLELPSRNIAALGARFLRLDGMTTESRNPEPTKESKEVTPNLSLQGTLRLSAARP